MLYNFAPRYREAIFKAIDNRWETDWYFGSNSTDIKGLDYDILNNHTILPNKKLFSNWYWQKGAIKLGGKQNYSTYFVLGDPYCLSTWFLSLRIRLFSPTSKKIYYWTHGWYGKENGVTKLIKKLFFKLANGVFLYGNYARELMIKEGFDKNRLFVIHNSLHYEKQIELRNSMSSSDIYTTHFGNNAPTLIFIGRLTKVKRLDLLLDAIAGLKSDGYIVNVVFVGDGIQSDWLKQKALDLHISDQCWFYGACYDEKINAELIYNADLCVAPGNVGLTAMHSMVFGTPVISHNDFKWQMPEFEAISDGATGAFFTKDDAMSLKYEIKKWLSSHTDRNSVRQACYKEIDSFWTPDFQMSVLEKNLEVK